MPIDFPNSPTNGDTYSAGGKNWQYNGTAWTLQGVVPNVRLLDDIGDVSASAPSDGQFLKYVTASAAWVPAAIPTINNLDDIGDVDVGGAQINDLLAKGESGWVDVTPSSIAGNIYLSDLSDVGLAPENVGEVIYWTGSFWNNETAASHAGRFNLDDIGDVTITSATSGQFLKWNGSAWVNAAVSTDVMTDTKNAAIILMDIGA